MKKLNRAATKWQKHDRGIMLPIRTPNDLALEIIEQAKIYGKRAYIAGLMDQQLIGERSDDDKVKH